MTNHKRRNSNKPISFRCKHLWPSKAREMSDHQSQHAQKSKWTNQLSKKITCIRQKAQVNERESVTICLRFNPDWLRKMCASFSANHKVWQCKNKGNMVLLPSCWYMELRVRAGSTWMGLTSRVTWTGTSSVWRWDLTNSSSARRDTGTIINKYINQWKDTGINKC